MKNKSSLIICLIIILGLGGYIVYSKSHVTPSAAVPGTNDPVACTDDAKLCPDGSAVGRSGPNCQFSACPSPSYTWSFKESTSTDIPQSTVTLKVGSKSYPLGTYDGSCSTIEGSSWTLLPSEVSGAICFYAGAGTELGVFEEAGSLVVKKGSLDEGDAETAGMRGDFQTLFTLGTQ